MYIKLTCSGICNDDPQKICLIFDFFFSIFKVGHQVRQKYGFLIKHAHWILFVCCFFSCYKKLSLSLFVFREKTNASQALFCPYNLLSQKRKMQTHDTRDETLRRKSSGGITDGLNWLKRHHNFSFFHQIFLYIFLHNLLSFFFVMFLHLNVVWWHDLYAKIFFNTENPRRLCCFHVRIRKIQGQTNSCCLDWER